MTKKATKVEKNFVEKEIVWTQDEFNKTWSEETMDKKLNLTRCYYISLLEEILYFLEKRNY